MRSSRPFFSKRDGKTCRDIFDVVETRLHDERERERERQRERDRETDRQTDRQTGSQADRQTGRQVVR